MWLTPAGVAAAVGLLAGCLLDRRKPGLPAFYSRQQNWFWMRGGGATAFQSERPNITFRVMYDLPGTNGLIVSILHSCTNKLDPEWTASAEMLNI